METSVTNPKEKINPLYVELYVHKKQWSVLPEDRTRIKNRNATNSAFKMIK